MLITSVCTTLGVQQSQLSSDFVGKVIFRQWMYNVYPMSIQPR